MKIWLFNLNNRLVKVVVTAIAITIQLKICAPSKPLFPLKVRSRKTCKRNKSNSLNSCKLKFSKQLLKMNFLSSNLNNRLGRKTNNSLRRIDKWISLRKKLKHYNKKMSNLKTLIFLLDLLSHSNPNWYPATWI